MGDRKTDTGSSLVRTDRLENLEKRQRDRAGDRSQEVRWQKNNLWNRVRRLRDIQPATSESQDHLCYPYFTDAQDKAQRGEDTYLMSHSW
jgi:hypothetical protein